MMTDEDFRDWMLWARASRWTGLVMLLGYGDETSRPFGGRVTAVTGCAFLPDQLEPFRNKWDAIFGLLSRKKRNQWHWANIANRESASDARLSAIAAVCEHVRLCAMTLVFDTDVAPFKKTRAFKPRGGTESVANPLGLCCMETIKKMGRLCIADRLEKNVRWTFESGPLEAKAGEMLRDLEGERVHLRYLTRERQKAHRKLHFGGYGFESKDCIFLRASDAVAWELGWHFVNKASESPEPDREEYRMLVKAFGERLDAAKPRRESIRDYFTRERA